MSLTGLSSRFRGIRFRLTLVYSTLFGLFICVFAYIITAQFTQMARDDFDSALLNYAIDLSAKVAMDRSGFRTHLKLEERDRKKRFPFIQDSTYYSVRSLDGIILNKSPNLATDVEIPFIKDLVLQELYTHRFLSIQNKKNKLRAVNLKIINKSGKELLLQVATSSLVLDEQEKTIILINVTLIPLLILISSLTSYIVAGHALFPIKSLTESANAIAGENLSLRVPVIETHDEVEELSKTLNNLLGRLQKSFKAQEHFVANASHQLNTPLAIIKGELDVLESKERSHEENQKFLKSLREEIERLISLVKNLLLISRVEAGQEIFSFQPVRLDDILMNTITRLSSKTRDKKISIRFNIGEELSDDSLMLVLGERQLLESLFENILENSIKYSPEESSISLELKKASENLLVSIQDEGPGIEEEEFAKILSQRFLRGSQSLISGTGIGLSIAYKIAQHHKASISYQGAPQKGSTFIVSIPGHRGPAI